MGITFISPTIHHTTETAGCRHPEDSQSLLEELNYCSSVPSTVHVQWANCPLCILAWQRLQEEVSATVDKWWTRVRAVKPNRPSDPGRSAWLSRIRSSYVCFGSCIAKNNNNCDLTGTLTLKGYRPFKNIDRNPQIFVLQDCLCLDRVVKQPQSLSNRLQDSAPTRPRRHYCRALMETDWLLLLWTLCRFCFTQVRSGHCAEHFRSHFYLGQGKTNDFSFFTPVLLRLLMKTHCLLLQPTVEGLR